MNNDQFFCPYCGSENSLLIDPSAGSRQKLIVDCEVCCRPIVLRLRVEHQTVTELEALPENE